MNITIAQSKPCSGWQLEGEPRIIDPETNGNQCGSQTNSAIHYDTVLATDTRRAMGLFYPTFSNKAADLHVTYV